MNYLLEQIVYYISWHKNEAMLFTTGKPQTVPIVILKLELKMSVRNEDDSVFHLQRQKEILV